MVGLPSTVIEMAGLGTIALRRVAKGGFVELANATTQRKCLDEVKRLLADCKRREKTRAANGAAATSTSAATATPTNPATPATTTMSSVHGVRLQRSFTRIVETDESPAFSVTAEEVMSMACAMQRCNISSLVSFVTGLEQVLQRYSHDVENAAYPPPLDLSAEMS